MAESGIIIKYSDGFSLLLLYNMKDLSLNYLSHCQAQCISITQDSPDISVVVFCYYSSQTYKITSSNGGPALSEDVKQPQRKPIT